MVVPNTAATIVGHGDLFMNGKQFFPDNIQPLDAALDITVMDVAMLGLMECFAKGYIIEKTVESVANGCGNSFIVPVDKDQQVVQTAFGLKCR